MAHGAAASEANTCQPHPLERGTALSQKVKGHAHPALGNLDAPRLELDNLVLRLIHRTLADRPDHLGLPALLVTPSKRLGQVRLDILECDEGRKQLERLDGIDVSRMRRQEGEGGREEDRVLRPRTQVDAKERVKDVGPARSIRVVDTLAVAGEMPRSVGFERWRPRSPWLGLQTERTVLPLRDPRARTRRSAKRPRDVRGDPRGLLSPHAARPIAGGQGRDPPGTTRTSRGTPAVSGRSAHRVLKSARRQLPRLGWRLL